ncbi:MAG: HAD-IIB family hydrolase [Pseudomonadota bacterium]
MPGCVIFTDLDGTLLDHHDYDYSPALPALAELKRAGVPLVLTSSKTRPEIEALRAELENHDPFIVENGGAIFIPALSPLPLPDATIYMDDYRVIVLGRSLEELAPAFDKLAGTFHLRALSRLAPEEIARLTGLTLAQARAARARQFGEGLVLDDPGVGELDLARMVESLGLRLTRGGRFYHLMGDNDKGLAVKILSGLYRKNDPGLLTAAIGDAPNDFPMLAAVDRPFLVAGPDGSHRRLDLPGLNRVPFSGPAGFNRAVLTFLEEARSQP